MLSIIDAEIQECIVYSEDSSRKKARRESEKVVGSDAETNEPRGRAAEGCGRRAHAGSDKTKRERAAARCAISAAQRVSPRPVSSLPHAGYRSLSPPVRSLGLGLISPGTFSVSVPITERAR